jgi:outer membrane protein insertion porin family
MHDTHDCPNARMHWRSAAVRAVVQSCLLAVVCAAPAAAEVADYLGKPVTSIRLLLDGRDTAEPDLVQVVETRVGRPLSMVDVRESLTHLYSLGRFDDVRVDATAEGGGVALRYELTPLHLVSNIEFVGLEASLRRPGIDTGQLRQAVVERYGASPPLGRVDDLSALVGGLLLERGYRQATVRPRVETDPGTPGATLLFEIDPGPRTLVGTITLVGTPMVSAEELLERLDLAEGAPYEPEALNARIESYVETRRALGHYQAQVVPAVSFSDDGRVAHLTLSAEPGPLVNVAYTGDPLPENTRTELVPIEREGSADEDLLEDSSNRIEEFLRAQGYRDARAPFTRREENGRLLITFDVRRGPQHIVGPVDISGGASLDLPDLRSALRTQSGEPYSDDDLDADAAAIESVYRQRGFAGARVQADARPLEASGRGLVPVAVSILISEGVRTVVGSVRIEGNASIPEAELQKNLAVRAGAPYFEADLRRDADAIQLAYANRGYRSAVVQVQPGFSADRSRADLVYIVREGPQVFVDHILIAGNVRTSTETIERELQLRPGDPLSLEAEYESMRRLAALQLFRRAPQLTELRHGDETRRDLLVTVEEAAPTTLGFGGGIEGRLRVVNSTIEGGPAAQKFELAPRAFVDVSRRNLFGTNRSANFFASVSFHPQGLSTSTRVGYGFTEYRVLGTYHEPRVFGTPLDGVVNGTVEQQIRSSFNLARRSFTLEGLRRLTPRIGVGGAYQLQHTEVLDSRIDESEQPLIDRVFTQVRLSSLFGQAFYDTRDEPLDSTRGEYVGANVQLAARRIGSEVGFAKAFFTGQLFRPARLGPGSVLALQGRLGIATGFPRDVEQIVDGETVVLTGVKDLPEPERFFAGGDTTVRGFAVDTLGRPETIKDGFPIGGNAETIFNVELRGPLYRGLQGVGFVDTGNVFARVVDIDLGVLRTAVGFGARYKSPVGPIRFDVGFKLKPMPSERRSAWFITFGQAF